MGKFPDKPGWKRPTFAGITDWGGNDIQGIKMG